MIYADLNKDLNSILQLAVIATSIEEVMTLHNEVTKTLKIHNLRMKKWVEDIVPLLYNKQLDITDKKFKKVFINVTASKDSDLHLKAIKKMQSDIILRLQVADASIGRSVIEKVNRIALTHTGVFNGLTR